MVTTAYIYFGLLLQHWWWFMTSGPLVAESVVGIVWAGYQTWADTYVSRATRRWVIMVLAIFGVFFAGFQAFQDVYKQLQTAQQALSNEGAINIGLWPRLTEAQRQNLAGILSKRTSRIFITCNDSGCLGLEKDLAEVFQESGWTTTSGPSIDAISSGIAVQGTSNDQVAKALPAAIHYVTGLQITFLELDRSSYDPNNYTITIIIGTKPI
jgi:hypothetical protein